VTKAEQHAQDQALREAYRSAARRITHALPPPVSGSVTETNEVHLMADGAFVDIVVWIPIKAVQ
jgi:hypothetical protein